MKSQFKSSKKVIHCKLFIINELNLLLLIFLGQ
jgi:hypothetical protein